MEEDKNQAKILSLLGTLLAPAAANEEKRDLSNEDLTKLSKEKLVELVLSLKDECRSLRETQEYHEKLDKRMEALERQQNMNLQYLRRDTIEIHGIPGSIKNEQLEDEVMRIYDMAGVSVHGIKLDHLAIQACHRIGKKGNVVVKFTNRKYATEGLYNGKNLKENKPYETPTYINNSFCPEFSFLNYAIRQAKKQKKIHFYKLKNGITSVQLEEGGDLFEITHKADLAFHGISLPEE